MTEEESTVRVTAQPPAIANLSWLLLAPLTLEVLREKKILEFPFTCSFIHSFIYCLLKFCCCFVFFSSKYWLSSSWEPVPEPGVKIRTLYVESLSDFLRHQAYPVKLSRLLSRNDKPEAGWFYTSWLKIWHMVLPLHLLCALHFIWDYIIHI